MEWHKRKPTKRDQKIVSELAQSLGVSRVYFAKRDLGCRGYCYYNDKTNWFSITIDIRRHTDRRDLYSTLMHEISHGICFQQRIYPKYHIGQEFKQLTRKEKASLRRTALRAELYVDRMGERMFRLFFPELRYRRGYRTKNSQEFLRLYWQDTLQE